MTTPAMDRRSPVGHKVDRYDGIPQYSLARILGVWAAATAPTALLDGVFAAAYPSRRYQSTWIGIVTHTFPSFVIVGVVLPLVLK
jgi:hypothetical protein